MITKVRLRNWKSHIESEFEFSGGVNAIIGIMGSGKTSIMQAMSFALFGTLPEVQTRRAGLDDLIMKKPQVMDESEVCLEFSLGEKRYSVMRTIRRGKGTVAAELREDDRLVEATAQGVTREVSRILDMDYELFSKAVYSEQNAIDYFLRIPKGQRMGHIDRMLRLDRFESARENAVSLSNRIRHGREERLRMLAEMRKEGLPERISSIRKELEGLQGETDTLEKGIHKAGKTVTGIEERISGFEDDEKELNDIRRNLEGVNAGMKQIEESISERMGQLKGSSREEVVRKMESAERAIQELEEGTGAARKSMEQSKEKVASLNTEMQIIKESMEDIQRLGDRCPLCESEISPAKKKELVESREVKSERLRKEVSGLVSCVEESGGALSGLESRLAERRGELEGLRAAMKDIESVKALEKREGEYEKRRAGMLAQERRFSERLKCIDMGAMRNELKNAAGEERELRARYEAAKQRIEDRQEMLRELRSREELMVKYSQESMLDQELVENIGKFVNAVRLTQNQLREEFLKNVNSTMSIIWEDFYPYGDFTGIRLDVDNDYVLQLKENGDWVSVEGTASGGERSMAALALRVAFSMAFIPNLRWLILDEPTHNLDDNAIEHLTDALKERIGSFVEQVFLITHDDRVSEGVGGNLYRLERDKNRNEPTKIVELREDSE